MSDSLFLIPDAVLAALQESINRFIALDPEGAAQLQDIQGQVLLIELKGFGLKLFIVPDTSSLNLYGRYDAQPDCIIRGTPVALLQLSLNARREGQIVSSEVEIIGDNRPAQRLGNLVANLDIDWEEQLARLLGDPIARQIGNQARKINQLHKQNSERFAEQLRNYLQEETRLIPNEQEQQQFLDAVDRLRDDVERLAARIDRLAASRP